MCNLSYKSNGIPELRRLKNKYLCCYNKDGMSQSLKNCLNCHHHLSDDDSFCPNCGQKKVVYTLTLKELWTNLWSSITNLDNTFFKTLQYIWKPWKLTEFYISGKRAAYMNPMRLFIITILFHFAAILSVINLDNDATPTTDLYNNYDRLKILEKIDTLKSQQQWPESAIIMSDSIEKLLKFNHKGRATDTLLPVTFMGDEKKTIHIKDAIELSLDSIYQKYHITTYTDKLLVKQTIRLNKDQAAVGNFIIGNLSWGIIFVVLLMAGLFKILYKKRKLPFVQHLVLLMNIHSLAFLVNSIIIYISYKLISSDASTSSDTLEWLYFIIPVIIFYISIYKYYQESIYKTAFKSLIFAVFYAGSALFSLIITAIISLFIF